MRKIIVRLVQMGLKSVGLYTGAIDSSWGPMTESAFRRYEADLKQKASPSTSGVDREDWRHAWAVDDLSSACVILSPKLGDIEDNVFTSVVAVARKWGLNPFFLLAISKHETGAWTSKAFKEKNNAMGVSDQNGPIKFSSVQESIDQMGYSLARPGGYYSKCKTLLDVSKVYAPIGATNDPTSVNSYWPGLVAKYWEEYEKRSV